MKENVRSPRSSVEESRGARTRGKGPTCMENYRNKGGQTEGTSTVSRKNFCNDGPFDQLSCEGLEGTYCNDVDFTVILRELDAQCSGVACYYEVMEGGVANICLRAASIAIDPLGMDLQRGGVNKIPNSRFGVSGNTVDQTLVRRFDCRLVWRSYREEG